MPYTALVTGSTKGIGRATAMQLAQLGWTVIIHSSNETDCQMAAAGIRQSTKNPNVDYAVCDLSLMADVARWADHILERFPDLTVLINNAGTIRFSRTLTSEGFETLWAVNFLSRFLLTQKLLPHFKEHAPSRIIDVSGASHRHGEIHFDDLTLEVDFTMNTANAQAKLANVLHTYALARRVEGLGVYVNTLHPGAVRSSLLDQVDNPPWYIRYLYKLISRMFLTPDQGAAPVVYLASDSKTYNWNGRYLYTMKEKESAPKTYDTDLQERLWALASEQIAPYL